MKISKIVKIILFVQIVFLSSGLCSADEAVPKKDESGSLVIARRTNIGQVNFWFTDMAESNAKKDDSSIDIELRKLSFDLIIGLNQAAGSVEKFEAFVIDKIIATKKSGFELRGVVIGGELFDMKSEASKSNVSVQSLVKALEQNQVLVVEKKGIVTLELKS
ncbi:MAG TPA: hypothetical protein VFX02_11330 [Gammaproteobacteria bacterium]|nr:hypothetical protein [Gammaproteobacteria bacterium]